MSRARITVLKRTFHPDLVKHEISDAELRSSFEPCPIFKEGDSYIAEGWPEKPEGFCPRAWADVRHEVEMVMHGATAPWIDPGGSTIACCNDGLRSVVFRIERMKEGPE